MGRLKRFAIGATTSAAVLGGLTAVWYRTHYILPPEPGRKVNLPSPNAFDTFQEAIKLKVVEKDGAAVAPRSLNDSPPYHYAPVPLEKRLKLVAANQPAIDKTREALRQEYVLPRLEPDHIAFPKLSIYRNLARMLSFASFTHAEAGNLAEALSCALDAIELGMVMPRGGTLVSALAGQSCVALGQRSAWSLADRVDAKTACLAVERLEAIEARRWPLIENLSTDQKMSIRTYALPMFQEGPWGTWKASGGFQDSMADSSSTEETEEENPEPTEDRKPTLSERAQALWFRTRLVYYGPRTVIANSDAWIEAVRKQSEQPWQANRSAIPAPTDPLGEMISPIYPQVEFKEASSRTLIALLRVTLAMRAYRLEHHGDYPKSLEDLVTAGYLKAVPVDPFSPTRAPLGYKPDGTLWSVGPDAKDDNGKPIDMKSKRGYVSVEKTGDFVARVNTN